MKGNLRHGFHLVVRLMASTERKHRRFPDRRLTGYCCLVNYEDDDYEYEDEDTDLDLIEEDVELPALTEAAIMLHEVYLALTVAGFEQYDALRMVTWLISEQGIAEVDVMGESDE